MIMDLVDNRHLSITEASKIVGLRYETAKSLHKSQHQYASGKEIYLKSFIIAPDKKPLSFK